MFVSTLGLNEQEQSYLSKICKADIVHCKLDMLDNAQLADIEGVFSYGYDFSEQIIDKMPALKWIHIGQSGMEYLPVGKLIERGIFLTNSRGINASNIAEYVLAMMLAHVRKVLKYYSAQMNCIWDSDTRMGELRDATLGVFGLGMAGREVVKRARAFDMRVLGMDISACPVEGVEKVYLPEQIKDMAAQCDYIVLTLPLTKATHHIISADLLKNVKKGAYLINCGRGALVDLDAVLLAIKTEVLSGACLDVFEKEPLLPSDRLWLWDPEKLIITPHIAGDHFDAYSKRMMDVLSYNLEMYPYVEKMRNRVDITLL